RILCRDCYDPHANVCAAAHSVRHFYLSYCHRPPRGQHSFPTRRSSDLHELAERTRLPSSDSQASGALETPANQVAPAVPVSATRSEEHTSELQSHLNLVCRLLLEKKKIASPRTRQTGSTAPATRQPYVS